MTPSPVNVGRATAPHRDEVGRSDTKRKKRNPLLFQTKIKKLCNTLHCVIFLYSLSIHSVNEPKLMLTFFPSISEGIIQ